MIADWGEGGKRSLGERTRGRNEVKPAMDVKAGSGEKVRCAEGRKFRFCSPHGREKPLLNPGGRE